MADLPARLDIPDRLEIAGTTFTRVESPESIACWSADADHRPVSVLTEPAAAPDRATLDLATVVLGRFDELADLAVAYLRERLREPELGLSAPELAMLDAAEPSAAEPDAVVWADGTWMLRFAESRLRMADPYGIGVLFEGTTPSGIEDLSHADLA
ncbi:hypothetical protein [Promicromonospora kroppenstedtii]|uniref:hypothetical protein n=1 Tax=Promicromonospora kroppenstedtii TaxID=440482 RepID=UPI0004B5229A|nr:hypothetical protein [Promicromonospora kroppenstedtii]